MTVETLDRSVFSPPSDGEILAVIPKYHDPLVVYPHCATFDVVMKTTENFLDIFGMSRYVIKENYGALVNLKETHQIMNGQFISRDTVFGEVVADTEVARESHHIFGARFADTVNFQPIGSTAFIDNATVIDVDVVGHRDVITKLGGSLAQYYFNGMKRWEGIYRAYLRYRDQYNMTPTMQQMVITAIARLIKAKSQTIQDDDRTVALASTIAHYKLKPNEIRIHTTYKLHR